MKFFKTKGKHPDRVIVLDPGHGGNDPGTVVKKKYKTGTRLITENEAALSLALTIKFLLLTENPNWKVYLTRKSQTERPTYYARTSLAERVNADAFVSVHFNSPGTYAMLYYAAEDPIQRELSRVFAKKIYYQDTEHFKHILPSTSSRFGRLYIDNVAVGIPSILVEMDAIDNYQHTKKYRVAIARKVVNGIVKYLTTGVNK